MGKKDKSEYVIQSVSHALDLLEEFKGEVDELGVTELARRLNLHKNNVFRLLATLEARGYIEQNKATENYRLGLKGLELGQKYLKQMGLLREARAALKKLVEVANETAYVSVVREGFSVYLDSLESTQTVRVVSRLGHRLPVYACAVGKAQIAYESEEELDRILPKQLQRFTDNTITDRTKLLLQLKEVAAQGYAVDNEEYDAGVRCIGVPIRDYTRRVVGGISISGPAYRMALDAIERDLVPLVKSVSEEVSRKLGYEAA